jgi:hypothetical protein
MEVLLSLVPSSFSGNAPSAFQISAFQLFSRLKPEGELRAVNVPDDRLNRDIAEL